jgi:hypothetical protein
MTRWVYRQFGKNHLGRRNEYLPTVHGFDEFYIPQRPQPHALRPAHARQRHAARAVGCRLCFLAGTGAGLRWEILATFGEYPQRQKPPPSTSTRCSGEFKRVGTHDKTELDRGRPFGFSC